MPDDDVATDHAAESQALVRVRAVLDGDIADGTHVAVHGTVGAVTVKEGEHTDHWAAGRLVDADDCIDFVIFPRAFARADRSCFDTGSSVVASAHVSISPERTTLVINSIERRTELGVDIAVL